MVVLDIPNIFSKKIENHAWAVSLRLMHCNFARIHKTPRITPAMAADAAIWFQTAPLSARGQERQARDMSQADVVGEEIAEVGAEDAGEAESRPEAGIQQG